MIHLKQTDGKRGFNFPVDFKGIVLVVLGYKYLNIIDVQISCYVRYITS
jgi:hypothetical protein